MKLKFKTTIFLFFCSSVFGLSMLILCTSVSAKKLSMNLDSLVKVAVAQDEDDNCDPFFDECTPDEEEEDGGFKEVSGGDCEVTECWNFVFYSYCETRYGTWMSCEYGGGELCVGGCKV